MLSSSKSKRLKNQILKFDSKDNILSMADDLVKAKESVIVPDLKPVRIPYTQLVCLERKGLYSF